MNIKSNFDNWTLMLSYFSLLWAYYLFLGRKNKLIIFDNLMHFQSKILNNFII